MINESLKNAFKKMWKNNLNLLDISKSDLNSHIHDDNPHNISTYTIGAAKTNHTHSSYVNQNAFSNVKIGDSTISADNATDTLTLTAGTNVTLTPDTTNDKVTITAKDTTYSAATTSAAGLMSATDKTKLDGIATGANKTTVDSALSSTSTNPVQNKVVNTAISNLNTLVGDTAVSTQITNAIDEITPASIGAATSSHTHSGYASSSHTHSYAGSSSAGGAANSVANSMTVQLNSGTTEGTNKFTFNGSAAKSVNITPSTIGAAASSHGTHVSYSSTNPVMDGTASVGSASTVARSDHKHPTDTTRAAASDLTSHTGNKSNPHGVTAAQVGADPSGSASSALASAKAYTDDEISEWVGDATVSAQISTAVSTKADASHTHNYAGSSSAGGSATSAVKLDSSAGSATQPVYFSSGKPAACTYTLGKSVPSDAKFTDTTYTSLKNPYALTLQGNGTTLTNGSYDGSAAKTVNITPSAIGAAPQANGQYTVTTAGTGAAYTATVSSISALTAGVSFIMVPHTASTSTAPTLNVNSLGAKTLKRRLSNMATAKQAGYNTTWLAANTPFRVTYDGTDWIVEGQTKPAVADLYGTLTIAQGGTGATTAAAARTNLGVAGYEEVAGTPTATPLGIAYGGTGATTAAGARQNLGIIDAIYPIGAVYISYVSTSPAELFGGTWTEITGVFPYFNAGTETGGSNTHTLTENEMPAHIHRALRYTTKKLATGTNYMAVFTAGSDNGDYNGNTTSTGGSSAHNNMPAYQTFYAWRRIA